MKATLAILALAASIGAAHAEGCNWVGGFLRCKAKSRLGYIVHERTHELSRFPSVADMVNEDWCGPEWEE